MFTDMPDPFDFVMDCGQNVADWLSHISNWGFPLLMEEAGCPVVVLDDPGTFPNNVTHWFCDNANTLSASETLGGTSTTTFTVDFIVDCLLLCRLTSITWN